MRLAEILKVSSLGVLALAAWAPAQTRIACVGDSDLMGSYPAELQRILGPKFDVKTFGKPKATVSPSGNSQFEGSAEYKAAIGFAPDAVVVLLGTDGPLGDSAAKLDGFEPAFRHLLQGFRGLPTSPRVYLWTLPEVPGIAAPHSPAAVFNQFIRPLSIQAAREAGASVIEKDVFGILPLAAGSAGARDVAQFVAEVIAPQSIKASWRIVLVSSFQADEGPAQNAIDGDPDTFWHSEYDPVLAKPPHEIVIDLGQSEWLSGFKYLPRQDGGTNGNVKDYEIYVGDSPSSQTTLAAKGTFRPGRTQKIARFRTSVKGRYVRFVCLSEENGQPFASAAELDVIRDPAKN